ncbi:MAG: hypothetical protein IJ424_05955 [Oscillospiraceae bacterium]|nr:hypothetical protein [Oscillospiraceae bacterium]
MEHRTIVVSPKNSYTTNGGVFEGWGTSLCWWANRLGYSDKLSKMAAELMFNPERLGLNIMRYNIGGGDDPTHRHITRTDSMIPGWLEYNSETGEYNYNRTADARQLNVLKCCVEEAGEDAYVEVFSNSPPYFWTVSGCSSGNADASTDNLKPECCKQFADYLANVTAYINNELGINVKSLAPMNEPNTSNWFAFNRKQEGCHVDAGESQSNIICDCYDALRKYGLMT